MKHAVSDARQLRMQLDRLISQTQLTVTDTQADTLVQLVIMLAKWNNAYNLTSVRDPQQMLIRLIMDSILVAPYVTGENVADVGTGPGLPVLPLAIMHPDKQFVLIDSLNKRMNFIRQFVHQQGLNNVTVVQRRVEAYQPEEAFDCVLSRAFASLADMLTWCHHLPTSQGQFVALKGQLDQQELHNIPANYQISATHCIEVPQLNAERHVVVLSQVTA